MGVFKKGHEVNKTHGFARTKIYKVWSSMIERCSTASHHAFARYGGRGIKVCDRWKRFENFLADMGERPDGKSLDRIENDLGYSPENCRWASREEQQNNTGAVNSLSARGEAHSISKWARIVGTPRNTIRNRMLRGWTVEEAIYGRVLKTEVN